MAIAVAIAAPGVAVAQGVNPNVDPELQQQYDRAFQAVFADPGNLDKTFAFAELAVKVGNFEAAISALERMLIINPELPRVRLELGVLYFRLGSYQLARTYLERAVTGPDVPAEVQERVAIYLEEINKRLSRHQFGGSVFFGARYQSNANAGPSSQAVMANGVVATLDQRFTKEADENVFAAATVRHTYDLQTQAGEFIETNGTAYLARQNEQKQLDLAFFRVDSGPRGRFAPAWLDAATIRPYAIGVYAALDDSPYLEAGGIGLNITNQVTPRLFLDLSSEFFLRKFHDGAGGSQVITQQDGKSTDSRATVRYAVTENFMLNATLGYLTESSDDFSFRSNSEWLGGAGATVVYTGIPRLAELGLTSATDPWTLAFGFTMSRTEYNSPDPSVDPVNARGDEELRLNVTQAIPITPDWTFVLTFQRETVDSSLPNFERNNTSLTAGASWRF